MATIERLIATQDLKAAKLAVLLEDPEHSPRVRYDDLSDTLLVLYVAPDMETVVHYIDGHVALLYEPNSREVVGFQVEAFETRFIAEHQSVESAWRLSDSGLSVENLDDLIVAVDVRKRKVARELTSIAEDLLERQGVTLEPVFA